MNIAKACGRLIIGNNFAKMHAREEGYIYFQEFIPENQFDVRVIVVGDNAFAIKRMIRQKDFRASGSGNIVYDKNQINFKDIKIAFALNEKIQSQSIAYDFIFDKNEEPLLVEISYGYAVEAYDYCPGYCDRNLIWREGKFNPQEWMVENLVIKLQIKITNEIS